MNDVITFNTEHFTVTVSKVFILRCPNPEKELMYDLINVFNLKKYLHNENGPAIIDGRTSNMQFYIFGKQITDPFELEQKFSNYFYKYKLDKLL